MLSHQLLVALTDYGNLAVVAPAGCAAALWLWLARRKREAVDFMVPIGVTFLVVTLLKIVSSVTGGELLGTSFALSRGAPSGHVAMSLAVYGGVALVVMRRDGGLAAAAATVLAAALLTAIAVTRVLLHAHTPADVATGVVIGAIAAWYASRLATRHDGDARPVVPGGRAGGQATGLLLVTVVAAVLAHALGLRFDSGNFL